MRSFQTLCMFSVRIFGAPADLTEEVTLPVCENTGRVRVFAVDAEDAARRACVMLTGSESEDVRASVQLAEHVLVWRLTWQDGKAHPQSKEGVAPTVITGPAYDANMAAGDDYAMAAISG
jgi:hypothetical protein